MGGGGGGWGIRCCRLQDFKLDKSLGALNNRLSVLEYEVIGNYTCRIQVFRLLGEKLRSDKL